MKVSLRDGVMLSVGLPYVLDRELGRNPPLVLITSQPDLGTRKRRIRILCDVQGIPRLFDCCPEYNAGFEELAPYAETHCGETARMRANKEKARNKSPLLVVLLDCLSAAE